MKRSYFSSMAIVAILSITTFTVAYPEALAGVMDTLSPSTIRNTSSQNALTIIQADDVGKSRSQSGAVLLDNSGNRNTGLTLYSNRGTDAQQPLARFEIDNPNWNEEVLYIRSDSPTSRGLIRLDSPAPEIEFVETDQSGARGKFELRVQHGRFQLNSRREDDTTFENKFSMEQDGSITVTGGAPSTIEGGLNVTGGCIAVDGTCLTANQPSATTNVTQAPSAHAGLTVLRAGAPASLDCNSHTEQGAMVLAAEHNRVYVCNGPERGWDYFTLTD